LRQFEVRQGVRSVIGILRVMSDNNIPLTAELDIRDDGSIVLHYWHDDDPEPE
jgi:hypothetical protein